MARFLRRFRPNRSAQRPGTLLRNRRWDSVMDKNNGLFGMIVGGIIALAAVIFIISGGELGGKKTVESDRDLPPVATTGQK